MAGWEPNRTFRMGERDFRAAMRRAQRGPAGNLTEAIRRLLRVYRAVSPRDERRLEARAVLEDRPVELLVRDAIRHYLDGPMPREASKVRPGNDDAPTSSAEGGGIEPSEVGQNASTTALDASSSDDPS